MPGLFRIVYAADSHARLMVHADDRPSRWHFSLPGDIGLMDVDILDSVAVENDVPVHQGLGVEVTLQADSIDAAIARALKAAESALILLAAASRAPIAAIRPIVAYDITPGESLNMPSCNGFRA